MLAAEVRRAERQPRAAAAWSEVSWDPRTWFQTGAVRRPPGRPTSTAARLGAAEAAWRGPGTVRLTKTRLVFEDDEGRGRSRLATVRAVERDGALLWVHRRRAHDWIARFASAADARRIEAALREAT